MEGFTAANVFWSVIILGLCILWAKIWQVMWLKPRRIRSMLLKQGIKGPEPHFFYGNFQQIKTIQSNFTQPDPHHGSSISHSAWVSSISPHLQQWAQQYGPVYLYSIMNQQHLYVGDPELMKAMNLQKSMDLGKPTYNSKSMEPLIGDGIIRANGPYWAHQRKLIAPEFFLNKAKHMLGLMEECATAMIRRWETQIESNGGVADISVDKDLKIVAADIISKACFGSSYSQGKQIFAKLKTLQESMSKQNIFFGIAHFRLLPTKSNKLIWRLQKEVETLILEIVNSRRKNGQGSAEKDLLQAMLENASNTDDLNLKNAYKIDKIIVDNCKNIYFAGQETTALTASWCLMLLALYPEWQQRIRTEILDICGDKITECLLDLDKLRQLKTLNMVIQETLRLYGPGVLTTREVFSDMKFGNITVPKGTNIWVFIPILHRDVENWGPDANEFRPERFSGSMAEACKYPQLYVPFGFGNRLCLGQTFATLQLKIVVSLLVSNFNFAVSPEYRHWPVNQMVLVPQHGIRLLVTKVNGN
uniref:Cytochrome p450 n=1 Tax=Croton stellatopilosus TaxID=431156 RepID=A0A3G2CJY5_9ROSI|nr:cytochrome p450 [Croton stellatopilosus]